MSYLLLICIAENVQLTPEESDAMGPATGRMRAIHRKARELLEERGIRAGYLAVGLARWDDLFLEPAAPVLLRGLTITASTSPPRIPMTRPGRSWPWRPTVRPTATPAASSLAG
jgi:Protein of unknown function (DUF4011)